MALADDQPPFDAAEFLDEEIDDEPASRMLALAFGPYAQPGVSTIDEHTCGVAELALVVGAARSSGCFRDGDPRTGPVESGAARRFAFAPRDGETARIEIQITAFAFVERVTAALYCREWPEPLWRTDLDWSDPARRSERALIDWPTPGDAGFADRAGARVFAMRAVTGRGGPFKLVASVTAQPGASAEPACAWLYVDVPWIELVLAGEDAIAIAGQRCTLQLADGTRLERRLDDGRAALDGIPAGTCRIELPDLDREAWVVDETLKLREDAPAVTLVVDRLPPGSYAAAAGESVPSIAERSGHFWKTLWDHPPNHALRDRRKNPNVLTPGDQLELPPLTGGQATLDTGRRHVIRRRGIPPRLRMQFLDDGEPRAYVAWRLVLDDGATLSGETDADGVLDTRVPAQARRATLTIGGEDEELTIGGLRPLDSPEGATQRLANLGLVAPDADQAAHDRAMQRLRTFLTDRNQANEDRDAVDALERLHDVL